MRQKQHAPHTAPPVICGKKRIPFAWFLAGAIMALFAFAAAGCEQRPSEQTAQTQPQSFPVLEALDGERLQEAKQMTQEPEFKGYIHDVGGPTADFRFPACEKQRTKGHIVL